MKLNELSSKKSYKTVLFLFYLSIVVEVALFSTGLIGFPVGAGHLPIPFLMNLFLGTGYLPALFLLIISFYVLGNMSIEKSQRIWKFFTLIIVSGFLFFFYAFMVFVVLMLNIG